LAVSSSFIIFYSKSVTGCKQLQNDVPLKPNLIYVFAEIPYIQRGKLSLL